MSANDQIYKALIVTYEILGQNMSDLTICAIAEELAGYSVEQVLTALKRCRTELHRMTLADIIDRLPGGHPGPEEAWALVSRSMANESISIAWTHEMAEAYGVAAALAHDLIASRLAFKEIYLRLVSQARANKRPPKWWASFGFDAGGREPAQLEVADRNRAVGYPLALPTTSTDSLTRRTEALTTAAAQQPDPHGRD